MTEDSGTLKGTRPRSGALLRSLAGTLLLPLKGLFRVMNRRQREILVKIPGVLAIYRSMSPWFVSTRSEGGIPCAEVNGLKMYLDPAEEASRAGAFLWGQYEPATTAVVRALVADGDTVVDVGAHWGYFALLAASLCGERGRVFAFEAHPGNFALLKRNLEANVLTNVVAFQKAVSNRAGSTELFQAQSTAGHSMVSVQPELTSGGGESIAVETLALDDFFPRGSAEPRLIIMDIEGAEPLALAGMRRLVERNPSLALIVEFNPSYLDAKAATDLLAQLTTFGFDVAIIDDDQRQLAMGPNTAVLKRLLERKTTCNLLAARDRSLFEHLLQQTEGSGKHPGRLERVGL